MTVTTRLARALGALLLAATMAGCAAGTSEPGPTSSTTPTTATGDASGPVRAPAATLTLLDGTTRPLRGDGERAAVIVFFSSWCTWCKDNQAALNSFAKAHQSKVTVIGVAGADDADAIAAYVKERSVAYPVGLDPDLRLFRAYAVSEPPLVALVSPSGELVRGWPGGVDIATLTKAVEALP